MNQPSDKQRSPVVLLTRPREQSLATARSLHKLGYRALIDPLLTIQPLDYALDEISSVQAVVLTSANAAPGLDPRLRDLPVFAVGRATAAAARRWGCHTVIVGQKDGVALAGLIAQTLGPSRGTLIHFSGEQFHGGLGESLSGSGFTYRRVATYRAVPATSLSARSMAALEHDELKAVMLYSPRSAAVFRNLVEAADLVLQIRALTAVCISDAVAQNLGGLPWNAVRVAAETSQAGMLRCLELRSGAP